MSKARIITALAALLAIPAMAAPAGYFQIPGTETTMKVYGKAETWAYYYMDNASFNVGSGTGTHESTVEKGTTDSAVIGRFGITSTTPSAYGDVNVKLEFQATSNDGNGNADDVNLRHAYGEFAGLLIGQTTSLMFADQYCPGYLDTWRADFWDTTYRTRQIRYTFNPTKEFKVAFSLEQDSTGGNSTKFGQVAVAAAQYSADWGSVQAAVGYQKHRDWSKTGTDVTTESENGVSFNVGGSWNITENDTVGLRYGNAGGNQGTLAPDGFNTGTDGVKFYKTKALDLGYEHKWNDKFSSNIGVAFVKFSEDDELGIPEAKLTEFFVNTMWQVTKNVKWGVEYFDSTIKFKDVVAFTKDNGDGSKKAHQNMFNMMFQYNFF